MIIRPEVTNITQTLVMVITLVAVVNESRRYRHSQEATAAQRKEDEEKAHKSRKIEIYQRLEIESNRVFEFEARHPELVPLLKRRLASETDIGKLVVRNEYTEQMQARQIAMIARKYYEMNCNLFEIAGRLRRNGLIDPEVFGSWVAWYFDTCTEWGFRALWADLRDNYTADLRDIFDPLCGTLIVEWDIPHFEGTFEKGATSGDLPDVEPEELEFRRREFYRQIGTLFECDDIKGWLEQADRTQLPAAHPLAYS
jgi:hypothetical protein